MNDEPSKENPSNIHSDDDNISIAFSNRVRSLTPENLLDEEQSHVSKKFKLNKPKHKYVKTTTYCGQQFLHDGSTGNMANHLRRKHNIHEEMNKLQDKSVQLTLPQILERSKIKLHKESRNKEIRQAITEWIVVNNLPINVIQDKGYRKMVIIIDPVFPISSNKRIKKEIHIGYTNSIEELKMLLTQWNSKYHSWYHLLKLRKAIEWLAATLPLSENSDDLDLLEPFNNATTYFSETSYATLSIIYPLIQVLKYKY
ncbi:4795_t:CDS:2, partial [Funneliformis geosporum]